jgi:hypothetical protein
MMVASLSGKGLRWRALGEVNSGPPIIQSSQGPDTRVLSVEDNPNFVARSEIYDLRDAANPIYGYPLPQLTLANNDALSLWGGAQVLFNSFEVKEGNEQLRIYGPDDTQVLRSTRDGVVYLSNSDIGTGIRAVSNLDMQDNRLLGDGFNSVLEIGGGINMFKNDPADADNANGEIEYFSSDPDGNGRGEGFYGHENGSWGKMDLTF